MNNKILVKIISPHFNTSYELFIPINEYVGVIVDLTVKLLKNISGYEEIENRNFSLMNKNTGQIYNFSSIVRDTDIKNATELILM